MNAFQWATFSRWIHQSLMDLSEMSSESEYFKLKYKCRRNKSKIQSIEKKNTPHIFQYERDGKEECVCLGKKKWSSSPRQLKNNKRILFSLFSRSLSLLLFIAFDKYTAIQRIYLCWGAVKVNSIGSNHFLHHLRGLSRRKRCKITRPIQTQSQIFNLIKNC